MAKLNTRYELWMEIHKTRRALGWPRHPVMPLYEIEVEYELPPLRAIYRMWFLDEGQSDDAARAMFMNLNPHTTIRKIIRGKLRPSEAVQRAQAFRDGRTKCPASGGR